MLIILFGSPSLVSISLRPLLILPLSTSTCWVYWEEIMYWAQRIIQHFLLKVNSSSWRGMKMWKEEHRKVIRSFHHIYLQVLCQPGTCFCYMGKKSLSFINNSLRETFSAKEMHLFFLLYNISILLCKLWSLQIWLYESFRRQRSGESGTSGRRSGSGWGSSEPRQAHGFVLHRQLPRPAIQEIDSCGNHGNTVMPQSYLLSPRTPRAYENSPRQFTYWWIQVSLLQLSNVNKDNNQDHMQKDVSSYYPYSPVACIWCKKT